MAIRSLGKILILLLLWISLVIFLSCVGLNNSKKPEIEKKVEVVQRLVDKVRARHAEPPLQWCQPLHFLPEPDSRPVTALASAPGSGNTWFRFLLQQASGVYTGSIYLDWDLKRKGFAAESVQDGSVSVVKLHEWGAKSLALYQRAVLLVRAPGPAILAEFNRQAGGHTGFAPPSSFTRNDGKYWERFVDGQLANWQRLNLAWLQNFTGPLHVVQYETLREALGPTLRATLHFLGLPEDEEALLCTAAHSEGSHKRRPRNALDPFTSQMKEKLAAAQDVVLAEIQKFQSRNQ